MSPPRARGLLPAPRARGRHAGPCWRPGILLVVMVAWGVAWSVACGAGTRSQGAKRSDAIVHIAAEVPDAELWVNDRFVGHVRSLRRGVALSPGSHRIELRHDGYHTHYEVVTVAPREQRTLTVELAQILP
jgi:hypothetical protein